MNLEEARKKLSGQQQAECACRHAMGMLEYDAATAAPKETFAARGRTLAVLSGWGHGLAAGPEAQAVLDCLAEHMDELSPAERRVTQRKRKNLRELRAIPVEEYRAYAALTNEARTVWERAKTNSDYALFEPYLARIVEANRRFAALVAPDKAPYDYLLDKYEEGLDMARCDVFFDTLRTHLVPLLAELVQLPQPDTRLLHEPVPAARQGRLAEKLMDILGLDRGHCGLGVTEHPFTMDFSKYDVRITTHYYENDFTSSMFSVIHEGGHALYELHTADEFAFTDLGGGVSMGIHESQSRFYENLLGRSREFVGFIYPALTEACPALSAHTPEELWRAVNRAEPSLIRTEADEFTYYLHVLVRYELEKSLISGEITTKELPERWNDLYRQYLGVTVPDDRYGVLQDSHWAGGQIGYFPSYALGSAYGAQLLAKMQETVDVYACLARGDFAPINAWLETRIWRFGSLYPPAELLERALGAPFDPMYYVNYLKAKAAEVYAL